MQQLRDIALEDILFLDIETASRERAYSDLSPEWQELWNKKATFLVKEHESPADVYGRAAIYAEFGKVICISVGILHSDAGQRKLRIKSFNHADEKTLLEDFSALLNKNEHYVLCAHNGKEFDFPYLCRRMIIHNLKLPSLLDNAGKKPWEVRFIDTLELWKFGDYKHFTSLNLLANLFGIPTPKDDIDGSMVGTVYWDEDDLPRITTYCQKDVLTLARVFLRMKGEADLDLTAVHIA